MKKAGQAKPVRLVSVQRLEALVAVMLGLVRAVS
jgi:hypothetical protein